MADSLGTEYISTTEMFVPAVREIVNPEPHTNIKTLHSACSLIELLVPH